ncbi:MAG TPA: hypothetical protein VNM39_18625 [Verrucomicrobiae bacterium]|nr:hypothetical protein [Verrucomicrobiae bacterium]
MVWKEPAGHVNERTPVKETLSTVIGRPGGSLRTVTDTTGAKVAVSLIGPFMITEAGLFPPVNDPGPLPAQRMNLRQASGVARIETTLPAVWNPLAGVTVPPSPALVVSMNWGAKLATKAVFAVGLTVCEIPPPSLQPKKMN